jgi:hypothetical protein
LVGLAGLDHGFFEILQGNHPPNGIMIEAIGPAQRFWEFGTERALTIIPSYLVSGILSIVLGSLVIIWSLAFIDRKYGAGILLLLCITLFLVGGGFAPIFLSILGCLVATQINKPLAFWRKVLPVSVRRFLAKLWLIFLIALVVVYVVSVEIAIFGWPLTTLMDADKAISNLFTMSYIMLGLMGLSILASFAHDIEHSKV